MIRSALSIFTIALLQLMFCHSSQALAFNDSQTDKPTPQATTVKPTSKDEKATTPTEREQNADPIKPVQKALSPKEPAQPAEIDWGTWNLTPTTQFGVGIKGDIEAELSSLDKSNLIDNASGVATTENTNNNSRDKKTKTKDLKSMMAELEAMEAKVKKEIDDDTEF